MSVSFSIGGEVFESADYTVNENATPLAAGDSRGSVGTLTVTIPAPDPDVFPNHKINVLGPETLVNQEVRLVDTYRGFTVGHVAGVSHSGGVISLDCLTRLGDLQAYDVQAAPFSGRLEDAFLYYLSLAGIGTEFIIDDALKNRQVTFAGWHGELWFRMKELAASQDCDISLVSGVVLFRPLREREAIRGRDIRKVWDNSIPNLAQSIEVYQYNNKTITNKMVYPPNGWISDDTVFTVGAGVVAEYTLNLNASLSSVQQPEAKNYVGPGQFGGQGSVYTVVADSGERISRTRWERNGGKVEVFINPDTTSLTMRVFGAKGLFSNRRRIQSYSLALPSDDDGQLRTTLRIVGTGVGFRKEKRTVPTSVSASQTATVVGVTIDNPFISTADDVFRMGTRAARAYAGLTPEISGSVSAINNRGDTGEAVYGSYQEVEDFLDPTNSKTYGDIQTEYNSYTYRQFQDLMNEEFSNEDINQTFGNVQGARIFDPKSRRYYRITSGTIKPGSISVTAENDLLFGDIQTLYEGKLYSDVQSIYDTFTYEQADLAGLYNG